MLEFLQHTGGLIAALAGAVLFDCIRARYKLLPVVTMRQQGAGAMAEVTVKAYSSPTCVLLAFDWPDGAQHEDFLGFAIRRTPGFANNQNFLVNKLDFTPLAPVLTENSIRTGVSGESR